jgi:hypothetical protein
MAAAGVLADGCQASQPVMSTIKRLYGFSPFDSFMIVMPVWVPYLATHGIGMRQLMELHAVFAPAILWR